MNETAQRAYTLSEVDRLRAAEWVIHFGGGMSYYIQGNSHDDLRLSYDRKAIEDRVRTNMVAGVSPEEVEAKAALVKEKYESSVASGKQGDS